MIALPIISIVCCFAYILFILFKYGVPVSISETYYLLPNKWDWLFAAWTVLTAVPIGIYWWSVSPDNLKWIPITVAIALLLVGAACCYKSGPKQIEGYAPETVKGEYIRDLSTVQKRPNALEPKYQSFWSKVKEFFKELKKKFSIKDFFKFGPARLIHYVNSLIAIILSTIYICMTCGTQAIAATLISYAVWIIVGSKVDGVYNPEYSLDVNNKAWIFFMEIVCFINLFVFVL